MSGSGQRLARGLVAGLVAALIGLVLVAVPSPTQAAGTASRGSGAAAALRTPKVGECHNLTAAQIAKDSEPSPVVPCTTRHTTEVVGVPTLPKGVPFDHSSTFIDIAEAACTQPFGKAAAGGDFRKIATSALTFAFFVPTRAQQAAGARWIRCDAFLLGLGNPAPLPGPAPYFAHGTRDRVARCSTSKYRVVPCDQPHAYRSVFSFKLLTAKPPTKKQAAKIAAQRCPAQTGSGPYVFANTSGAVYRAGWRTMECERKTTS